MKILKRFRGFYLKKIVLGQYPTVYTAIIFFATLLFLFRHIIFHNIRFGIFAKLNLVIFCFLAYNFN